MLRDLFLGFIKVHILHHAAQEPVYGAWLMGELERHGYTISPGTLYPTLHALERDGYLTSERRVVEGRQRRYYRLTPAGQRALERARRQLIELVDEVVDPHAPSDPL
jgi:DNA-binding PadR family transcriptional regulator